ncbi:MAG: hypothetical protein IJ058_13765 [Lachnospiraceae bacterium]|nr:hypothetical protein [Lachnospiraceae bacterium]MBQ8947847.1 hypothetical protein [Lachnospiraceae bacterium]
MYTRAALLLILFILGAFEYAALTGKIKRDIKALSCKEIMISSALSLVLMLLFAGMTGILGSEYHFVDDHELLDIKNSFLVRGFWGTLGKFIRNDLTIRFRPTYYLIRVIQTWLFRDNFFAWHVMYAVIAAVCLELPYVYARSGGCPMWLSYVFSMMIYVGGGQSPALWRLGPQEAFGMILLLLVMIALRSFFQKGGAVRLAAFLITMILLAGVKESFLVVLPFLPVVLIKWEVERSGEFSFAGLKAAIQKYAVLTAVTLVVFAASVCIILFKVGTNEIGYAGIDSSFAVIDYIIGICRIVTGSMRPYIFVWIAGNLLVAASLWVNWTDFGSTEKFSVITDTVICDMLMAMQLVLYAKSGMTERYLLPASLFVGSFWFLTIYRLYMTQPLQGNIFVYSVLSLAIAVIMIFNVNDVKRIPYIYTGRNDQQMALNYARDGAATTEMLNKVGELAGKEDNIVADIIYEADISAAVYLKDRFDLDNVYAYGEYGSAEEIPVDMKDVVFFIGYPDVLESRIAEYGMQREDFTEYRYFIYALWVKNGT